MEVFRLHYILEALKINTDDCTIFMPAYGADNLDEKEVRLALASELANCNEYSFHCLSATASARFEGLLSRQTVTLSCGGYTAAPCFAVPGFTERQIPKDTCPDGLVVLAIRGLCIGSNVDVRNQNVGYIVLLRKDPGIDEKYFLWYDSNIRMPFVENIRQNIYQLPPELPVPRRMQASLTTDGGIPQIRANTRECVLERHRSRRNIIGKLAAGCSAVTQECDLNKKGFRSTKAKLRILNRTSPEAESMLPSYQAAIAKAEREYGLKLSSQEKRNIGLLAKRAPAALTASYDSQSIKDAAIASGRIDAKYHKYPDLDKMISTRKRQSKEGEMELLTNEDKFTTRQSEFLAKGIISESTFDDQDFPQDSTGGVTVEKTATIGQEHCQRCKVLCNPHQRAERQHAAELARQKAILTEQRSVKQTNTDIRLNTEAESMLHNLAGRPPAPNQYHSRRHLADYPLEYFGDSSVLRSKYLRAFCKSRKKGFKKINLGKLANVQAALEKKERGEFYDPDHLNCLIYQAYLLRAEQVLPEYRAVTEVADSSGTELAETIEDVVPQVDAVLGEIVVTERAPSNIDGWIDLMQKCFVGVKYKSIDDGMMCRAKAALPILSARLLEMKNRRLPECKLFHFTMEFVADNIYCMLIQHSSRGGFPVDMDSSDISAADIHSTPLLGSPADMNLELACSREFEKRKGGYGHYDKKKKTWPCQGQTVRTYKIRSKEHVTSSKLQTEEHINSDFYFMYADESVEVDPQVRAMGGRFQDLEMHVTLAFSDYGEDNVGDVDNGLFYWSKSVLNGLEKSNSCKGDMKKRKLAMVSCLIEVFHGLLMSPDCNVSLNPSYEHELGVNNHGKK